MGSNIDIQEARMLLGTEFDKLSDEEIKILCDGIYKFCSAIIKYEHKKSLEQTSQH